MPLGSQFDNTFYVDEHGKQRFFTETEAAKYSTPVTEARDAEVQAIFRGDREKELYFKAKKNQALKNQTDEELNNELQYRQEKSAGLNETAGTTVGVPGVSYQGMLFSPHWGTGSSQDPSLSYEDRYKAAGEAFGTPTDSVAESEKRSIGEGTPTHPISEAGTRLPTHILNKAKIETKIDRVKAGVAGTFKGKYYPPGQVKSPAVEGVMTVPQYIVNEGGDTLKAVVTHEMGHGFDPRTSPSDRLYWMEGGKDPLNEGIAEGFADRHHVYARERQSTIEQVTPKTVGAVKRPSGGRTGYTPDKWPTRTGQALFIAARYHTSLSDHPVIPSRTDLLNQDELDHPTDDSLVDDPEESMRRWVKLRDTADQHVLGHLYHHHQHVRDILQKTGYKAEGEQAAQVYREAVQRKASEGAYDWDKGRQPHWQQQEFDFGEH